MTRLETKYPCPVCLGVTLKKTVIAGPQPFTVDHCGRCGGVWFDTGEVHALQQCKPEDLWTAIANIEGVHTMPCHSCSTPMDRDTPVCAACGWKNELDCPKCGRRMQGAERMGIHLDACAHCKGVWFDRHELAAIWSHEFTALTQQQPGRMSTAGMVALDVATDPFFLWYGAPAMGHAIGAGLQAAPGLLSGAGEVAAQVFEVIVDIISGIFD